MCCTNKERKKKIQFSHEVIVLVESSIDNTQTNIKNNVDSYKAVKKKHSEILPQLFGV